MRFAAGAGGPPFPPAGGVPAGGSAVVAGGLPFRGGSGWPPPAPGNGRPTTFGFGAGGPPAGAAAPGAPVDAPGAGATRGKPVGACLAFSGGGCNPGLAFSGGFARGGCAPVTGDCGVVARARRIPPGASGLAGATGCGFGVTAALRKSAGGSDGARTAAAPAAPMPAAAIPAYGAANGGEPGGGPAGTADAG